MLKDNLKPTLLLKKTIFILFLIFLQTFNAQRKKADTVYVYEKVIVYDTIYLEKAIKLKPKEMSIKQISMSSNDITEFTPIKDKIEGKTEYVNKRVQLGIEAGFGFKKSSWAKDAGKDTQTGFNLGLWLSKPIFNNFSLILSAHMYQWNSTFDLDGNKEDTWLNGYYFSEDAQPLLFQKFNNKHVEYAMQLKLQYKWKNIRPFIGILGNKNVYKMQFLVPDHMVMTKLDDFKSQQINLGFSLGLQYQLMKKILLSLEYQEYKMRNVSLKNSSYNFDIFQTNNTFAERKINFGVSYIISGH